MKSIVLFFENFNKIFTGLTFFVIVIGYLDLYMYYKWFNIDIAEYLTVSEVIITSISNLFYAILYLVIPFISLEIFLHKSQDYLEDKKRFSRKQIVTLLIIICSLLSISMIAGIALEKLNDNPKLVLRFISQETTMILLALLGGWGFYDVFRDSLKKNFKYPIEVLSLLTIVLIYITLIFYNAKNRRDDVLAKNEKNIQIIFGSGITVATNDSIGFIGKTENYYFFYNRKQGTSNIYPCKDFKETTITGIELK